MVMKLATSVDVEVANEYLAFILLENVIACMQIRVRERSNFQAVPSMIVRMNEVVRMHSAK
jgi:hypothetical protein